MGQGLWIAPGADATLCLTVDVLENHVFHPHACLSVFCSSVLGFRVFPQVPQALLRRL